MYSDNKLRNLINPQVTEDGQIVETHNAVLTIEEILKFPEMQDVKDEIEDPRFGHRSHGSRATLEDGCHGPLCRKIERDRGRRRREAKAKAAGIELREKTRDYDRDDLLDAIIRWHKREVFDRKMDRLL